MNHKYWERYKEISKIAEDRGSQYGDIETNFTQIANTVETMFGLKLKPSEVIEVMIATKVSREKFKHKQDNTDDVINYYRIRDKLKTIEGN